MSVIVDLTTPSHAFELGRILQLESGTSAVLENLVPLGEKAVPFFTVYGAAREEFEAEVENHPSVGELREVSVHDDEVLYALDWEVERDLFFEGLHETKAQLLSGTGSGDQWFFELRFPSHDAFEEFQEFCSSTHIPLNIQRMYNPTRPDSGPWYGLTRVQRETLAKAVQEGYYDIPRKRSTDELADSFDISDQAVTERLRRAIVTLVENTIIAAEEAEERADSIS
jgi:hypothetical protein